MKDTLYKIRKEIINCKKCPLWKTRRHAVPGEGPEDAKIMIIGQAPGREEDNSGRPFVGRAGRLLSKALKEVGLDRKEVFITSVLKCYPPKNRKPDKEEIDACLPYLFRQISIIKPKVILVLGRVAEESILGKKGPFNRIENWKGIEIIITYHPAAVLRNPNLYGLFLEGIKKAKEQV